MTYHDRILNEACRMTRLGQKKPIHIKRILKLLGYAGRAQFGN